MSRDPKAVQVVPLSVRKNLRDEWDSKKPKFEAEISKILGKPWKIDINPLAIYPYAQQSEYDRNSVGKCIAEYLTSLIKHLKKFVDSEEESNKDQLNSVCPTYTITLLPSTEFRVTGCKIDEGQLQLFFNPEKLGYMTYNMGDHLDEAVSEAPKRGEDGVLSPISPKVRTSIKLQYDDQIEVLQGQAHLLLRNPELKFETDFESIAAKMEAYPDASSDWQDEVGNTAIKYFEGLIDLFTNADFGNDDRLRDKFAEAVPNDVVRLQMVKELVDDNYWPIDHSLDLDKGTVVIETSPTGWGVDTESAAKKLMYLI